MHFNAHLFISCFVHTVVKSDVKTFFSVSLFIVLFIYTIHLIYELKHCWIRQCGKWDNTNGGVT